MKEMTYAEFQEQQAKRKAEAQAEAHAAPYLTLFKATVTMPDTGGGGVALRLLLSLYNGGRFKFDLTDLRRLDWDLHAAAIIAMTEEVGSAEYVHHRISRETGFPAEAVGAALEHLAYQFGIKGAVARKDLPAKPGRFDFGQK